MEFHVWHWDDDPKQVPFIEEESMGSFRECQGTRHYFEDASHIHVEYVPAEIIRREAGDIHRQLYSVEMAVPQGRVSVFVTRDFFQGRTGVSNAWWSRTYLNHMSLPRAYKGYRRVGFRLPTDSDGAIKIGS